MNVLKPFYKQSFIALLICCFATPLAALQVITEEDFTNKVITEKQFVRIADNAIFLVDTSSSMNEKFMDTDSSKLQFAISEFKKRMSFFPNLGHTIGIYEYTPWVEHYPLQTFDREKALAAINKLPTTGSGVTPIRKALERTIEIVKPLQGQTAVFLMYDGKYTGANPDPAIWQLIKENKDVCLIMISSAKESINVEMEKNIGKLNSCSRLIRLEDYLLRPEHTSGILFDVRATEKLVTVTEKRVVGLQVKDMNFNFDDTELKAVDKEELDKLAAFLKNKPEAYVILSGYTDNTGVEEYNRHLSRDRVEMAAGYLKSKHNISSNRIVTHWFGSANPVASNSTEEGRAKNRRVEIDVAGIKK